MASINISSRDQFGESQYLSKYSEQLVELMQPVALQANKSLYSEEYQSIANRFQALVSAKVIDNSTAQRLTNEAFSMYMNPYNTVANGTAYQKMVGINTIANGGIDSPASWVKNTLSGLNYTFGIAGNSSFNRSIVQNALGTPINAREWNSSKYGSAMDLLGNIENLSEDELNDVYNREVANADNYNTNSQKVDTAILNATADIGDIKSIITDKGWAIGEVIVSGITAWLGAKLIGGVIGKGVGALAGIGGGAGAGILAVGGGIALGAAAGLLISKAIDDGVRKAARKENEKDKSKASMQARGLAEDLGISEGTASLNIAGSNIYNSDKNWAGVNFDSYEAAELFGAKLGMWDTLDVKDFDQTLGDASKEADTYKYNKAKIGKALFYGGLGSGSATLSSLAKAWMIGLYSQGYTGKNANIYKALADTLNIGAFTPDEASIAKLLTEDRYSRSQFDLIVKAMKDADMWLWNDNGKWVMPNSSDYDKALKAEGISDEDREWLGSHRYGLDKVPYDNYLANLHQGEAVLTSSTASELRNLLTEYRANNQSAINLDVAIQNQTVELVNKLNEVITTIRTTNSMGGMMSTASSDQATAVKKLQYSMTHLISTKSALD